MEKLSRRVEREWDAVKNQHNSQDLYEGLMRADVPECLARIYQIRHEELMQHIQGTIEIRSYNT